MTDKQFARIKKPSLLIDIALGDMVKVRRRKGYHIIMSTWHAAPNTLGSCAVCLAGSVMACSLKTPKGRSRSPLEFASKNQLFALNHLRVGEIGLACNSLGIPRPEKTFDRYITWYDEDHPGLFTKAMRRLQKDLVKVGL